MFFNKQPKQEVCNHKVCYKCGHLFETGGKEVKYKYIINGFRYVTDVVKLSFCNNCIPKYDYSKEEYVIRGERMTKETHYFRHQPDIEVNEKGEPIKKK